MLALLALCVAVAVVAGAPSVAAGPRRHAIQPPAGGLGLDRMALAATDLPAGASVRHEGYVRSTKFVAYYVREFAAGAKVGSARLTKLESDVGLAADAAEAAKLASSVGAVLRTRTRRRSFARSALADAGWDPKGMTISSFSFRAVATGDSASLVGMTLTLPGRRRFALVLGLTRVERALQLLYLLGAPNVRVSPVDVGALLGRVSLRMRAELVPAVITAPSIAGVAADGQILTSATGAWTNAPTSFGLQWLRCDPAGARCVAIEAATGSTYPLSAVDVGSTIEVSIVATNAAGSSAPAVSTPTAVVAPAAPAGLDVSAGRPGSLPTQRRAS
jgi:hypothetical protein